MALLEVLVVDLFLVLFAVEVIAVDNVLLVVSLILGCIVVIHLLFLQLLQQRLGLVVRIDSTISNHHRLLHHLRRLLLPVILVPCLPFNR